MTDSDLVSNISSLKKKAVKGAGINVVTQFISFIFHTAGVIILARLLSPRDFGLVAMVTAFSIWIMNFGINGFTEYIIQKKDVNIQEINSIFWSHLFLASILSAIFILFSFFLVDFYKEPSLIGIAAAMSSSFPLYALYTCHFALLKREMKFAYISVVELIALIMSILLSIAAAITGMGYWAVVIRQLTLPIVTVIAAWLLRPWRPQRPEKLLSAMPALKYAFKVYCNFSLGHMTRNIDKVLLGKFHGSEVLGNYDRAYHLSMIPGTQLITPLNSVALATLSRLKHDRNLFTAYYVKAVSTISLLGTVLAVVLMLTSQDLILLLLGPAWTATGSVLMALAPGIAAMLIYGTHSWLHLSLGTPGRWLRWNIFASIITICAFIIALPYGAVAMGLAYSIRTYILLTPALWYAGLPVQLNPRKIFSSIWPYITSAFVVCVFWLFVSTQWPLLGDFLSSLSTLTRCIMIAGCATVLYFICIAAIQRSFKSIYDIGSLVRIFLKREKS